MQVYSYKYSEGIYRVLYEQFYVLQTQNADFLCLCIFDDKEWFRMCNKYSGIT